MVLPLLNMRISSIDNYAELHKSEERSCISLTHLLRFATLPMHHWVADYFGKGERAMMKDQIGQQLGNYRLVSLLGRGGFAEVYLSQHVRLRT
jgi:serine/threonine protein kinase